MNIESIDFTSFDTSLVTNISGMFQCCSSIEYVDLSSFDTSLVTDMSALFRMCSSLKEVDITNFTFRKNVNTMLFFSPQNNINKVYVKDETALNIVKGFGIKESKISIGHPIPC